MVGKLKYKDLDLKGLREKCDIDFAHFTYKKYQCSCCYGPKDLPAKYWRNNTIPTDKDYSEISYILFKNAYNGSGRVKREDYLSDKKTINIEWNLNDEQLNSVCKELERQVNTEFKVIKPNSHYSCIQLERKDDVYSPNSLWERHLK